MPAVFVHGNPETAAIWDPLLLELVHLVPGNKLICLSPPGFGARLPAGFGATVHEYRDWLIAALEAIGEPVDLVGHDWGGLHVLNVALSRPDLLRSWASDTVGIFHPDYVWHELALRWQTPGAGEADVAVRFHAPAGLRVARLAAAGMSKRVAEQVVPAHDEAMGRAILALYRSAAQPVMAELGRSLERAAQRPGLAFLATEDRMVGTDRQRRSAARQAGARVEVLDGLGHWWMTQDPAGAARALAAFWQQVGFLP
ncbi:alpha/beta fold hydrolase [Amycolatopsis jejuensis]|uniref:alpha/beta fold hydrolase n=1 Tax=Amycolatopsis jejuensis TaxID=330084 RepID=UPI000523F2BD|nr:alpha/beta fold hydrolase [Amycolatopsis jejuensis]